MIWWFNLSFSQIVRTNSKRLINYNAPPVSIFCLRKMPTTPKATSMASECKIRQSRLCRPPLKNENRSGRVVNGENFEGGVALVRYLQQRIDQHRMWLIELSLAIYQGGGTPTGGKSQLGVRIQAFKHASHNPNKEERSVGGKGRGQFRWDWDVFFVCTSLALSLQLGDQLLHEM